MLMPEKIGAPKVGGGDTPAKPMPQGGGTNGTNESRLIRPIAPQPVAAPTLEVTPNVAPKPAGEPETRSPF
jgi:hypothetical protein